MINKPLTMRPLYQVLKHLLFASLTRAQFGVQNDRSVLGINNEFSGVCYTYVSVYPVLADPDYITITKPYRGSVTTQYTVPPQGDEPGIVIVEQPGGASAPENVVIPATDDRSYVIIIRPHSGPNPISAPITQVVPPRSGQPGQIIIETPETQVGDATPGVLQPLTLEPKEMTGYVTVLQPLTGTLASLQLITISPTGTNRGSVIINVPTSALNGGSLQGLTLEPAQDGDYITVIEPAGTSFRGTVPIRLTVPPSNGNPGTVIIQTPVPGTLRPLVLEPLTPNTLGALGLAGQTITLQPADATGYVTIIEPAEGSVTPTAPIRTTIPPTGTKPGTVLIQTPPGWNDGGDGTAFQPTRTRPQGSVSYTTITRGVPMDFGGSGSGSDGGSNGGSGSGGEDDEDDGSGSAQGRPGQGGDDESGPRQTLTIPPEAGNPGTVLVLTPEDPNNPQTGNNGEGDNGAQATGGSSGGSQGGSGGGSDSSSGGNGQNGGGESSNNGGSGGGSNSGSGSSSGQPGQGGSSSNGGSAGGDDDPIQGGVQGSGSGSEGDDEDSASGNGGSSGSNNGNGSSNGGSSSSGGGNTGSGGKGGTQGGAQGGSDSEGGSGGSGTRSAGSSSSTKGASSGGSGGNDGPTSGDTESEGGGSESGSDSGNGSSGGTGSTSGGKGSSGDDDDSGSGGNAAGGNNGGSGQSSSSRRASTSRRPTTRSPIVRTSPSTYVVTSSSTVFTITADVVETLTNAEPQRTRRSSSTRRLTAGVEGLGGTGTAATDRTTFRRPSNSRSAGSAATASGDAESDSQQTTQAPGRPSSTRRAGASSSSDYSGTVDTRVRPGGSGLGSTRSRTSTSGQASRPVNDETTIVDSGPVETNDPGSDAEEATSSGGNATQSSSATRSGQGLSASQSISTRRPAAATSSSGIPFTARPAVLPTSSGNAEAGGTSQASQRSSRSTSSASVNGEAQSRSTAAGNNGGASSDDADPTSQGLGASSGSQSTSAGPTGSSSASAGSSATTSGGTSPVANTRDGGSPSTSGAATGSSRSAASTPSRESSSVSDAGSSQSEAARGSSAGTSPASQGSSQSSSATRRTEELNFETLIGTQSVPESDRVEQPGDTSSTRSATSSGAGLTGQPAGGVGGSTTAESNSQTTTVDDDDAATTSSGEALTGGPSGGATSRSAGESPVSDDSDAETSAASRDPGSETASDDAQETGDPTGTAQPENGDTSLVSPQVPVPTDPLPETGSSSQSLTGRVEGISAISDPSFESPELPLPTAVSTGPLPDSNLLSTATDEETSGGSPGFEVPTGSQTAPSDDGGLDPDSGETATDGPTRSETSEPDSSSDSSDDEASETGSGDPGETGTGVSGGATQSGSSGNGNDDGASITVGAGAEPSDTDTDTDSETSDPDATTDSPGPGAGPNTDEDDQTITDASGGNPTAGIPADNSLTTDAPGGALETITVFRAGRGPARTTLYVPPQASNDPWTVVIETPVSETQSEAATARGDDDVLATTTGIGGNTNVTIFRAGSSPARRTLYVPPRFANEPGTIIIETPTVTGLSVIATATETGLETTGVRPNITVYSSGTASSRITIYVPPTASDGDGYIIIETPVSEADTDATESAGDGSGPTAGSPAGIANVTVYSSGTASEIRTLYIPPTASGEAGTIIIETPVSDPDTEETGGNGGGSQTTGFEPGVRPNVTVYSSGTASERITLYIPPTASGEAGTIVIQTPVSDEDSGTITGGPGDESGNTATSEDRTDVTIYTEATGSPGNTRYISPTVSGERGTYIIETLASEADEETASNGSAEITGPEASITPVPTDEVSPGDSRNVTLYRAGEGSERSTIFIPPETTGDPWTIVIETPISQTELVETGTASGFQTTVSAITGIANLTIFRAGAASTTKTIYVAPKTSGAPGTVIIETPVPRTQTSGLTANPEAQTTVGAGSNTTIFVPGTGPGRTTYYVPPSDPNDPGTVYVETPVSGEETEEPTDVSATGTDVAPGSGINVTEYSGVAGSVTRTIYIPPTAPGEDGIIIIETPTSGPDGGSDDTTESLSGVTVIVARTAVTVYSGGPGSVTRTVYVPPTASDEAGTMYIETPTDSPSVTGDDGDTIVAQTTVTVFSGGPGSVTRTVYVPPTASGEAGTLYIETPTGSEATATGEEEVISATRTVTVYTGVPGSVTRTVYVPPTAIDEPGTLFIETPVDGSGATATDGEDAISAATTVTIFSGGPGSVTRSVYVPPTASGEAGTMHIETPTDGSEAASTSEEDVISAATTVTIFSGGPASVTRTVYIPPTASGEAGTLIIETPTEEAASTATDNNGEDAISDATTVTIFSGGPASVNRTVYIPPTASGEAGTLIIETPADGSEASLTSDGGAEETEGSTETGAPTEAEEEAISAATTVTIFSGGPAAVTRTTYIPPTASGEAGTLVIVTPTGGSDASTIGGDGDSSETGSITDSGEITARTTVTIFSGGSGSATRTGTLIVETPTSDPDDDDDSSITGTGASGPTAIVTPEGPGNVTIYSGGPASSTTTRFIPATASGEPGTVVIETPTAGPQATGIGNVTIVTGGPATVTQTRYIPATVTDEPGTIVIETPTSQVDEEGSAGNTTIYSAVSATGTRTIYIPPTVSGEPGTVIVETPAVRAVTVYTDGPASTTRTLTIPGTASGDPDTILIETPTSDSGSGPANVTVYTGVSATVATTRFVPGIASDEPGTFIVETPIGSPTYVTVYSGGPGTAVTTIYLTPSASGDSTTMIIQTPAQGSEESATGEDESVTVSETGSQIATPSSAGNVTIYSGGPGTVRQTIYIPPTASGEQGTVIIETPTSVPDVEASETVAPTGIRNVTIVSGGPGTATRTIYIPPTASGEAGTIVIETPTDSDDDTSATETSQEAAATTIAPTVSGGNVTIISGGPASVTRTVYIPPTASGEPGTVIIETPTGDENSGMSETGTITKAPGTSASRRGNVTIYTQAPGTAGGTFYFPPDDPEESGTVIIETLPGDAEETEAGSSESSVATTAGGRVNTTIFSGGPVTAPRTLYIPATVSGEPDTVLVETPTTGPEVEPSEPATGQRYTTIFGGGSGTATRTITIPATVSGELDTVLVETATGGAADITITRGGPVSVATTITIPGAPGEPDTVLIETPTESGDSDPSETGSGAGEVTSTRGGPVTAATTITIPGESGQPDTVIVETPTSPSDGEESTTTEDGPVEVTSTRGGPVTAATTITIPGQSGQPDTVIVETPTRSSSDEPTETGDGPVEVTSIRGGPATAATTITIPGQSGEPDTVIIETPTRSSDDESTETGDSPGEVTSTRGGPVTAATTITIPGESGEPDTVIVETPARSNEPSVTGGVQAITSTRGGPVTAATTITIPGESGQPDTVIVETPRSSDEDGPSATDDGQDEVTITRGGPVTAAITVTIPGVSGGPDTVYIETPTESANGSAGTGAVQEVTITRGGPVTAATTVTISGVSGGPGTVYIETPTESAGGGSETTVTDAVEEITITRGGPVTAATTRTIPGVSGGPDTVYVEIPTESATGGTESPVTGAVQEITITRGGPVTAATTITIPGESGGPDTVLVEVPAESAERSSETGSVREVTITRGGPVTAATTRTIPGESGGPDTVLIETPNISAGDGDESSTAGSVQEVTITRGGPVTAATTLTIPGESGGPNTVLIETPTGSSGDDDETSATGTAQGEVTITRAGPVTAPTTLTIPGASGQPDTVVVETPTESPSKPSETNDNREEVTITRGGPVTAATTITLPGVSGGPDTVIVETPTGAFETPNNALANVTVYSGGPVLVTRTIYLPPDASGEAGTIVIETPDGSSPTETARGPGNVTIYTGIPGTATRTLFVPATASGEPGTILIETPTGSSGDEETTGSIVATATGPLTTSEGRPNTTIFSGGSGSSTRTIYFPPASDDPDGLGTVVIETPTSGSEEEDPEATTSAISSGGPANITRIVGGPASVTTTIYIPPTASGEPGIVIIETPTSGPEDTAASESAANTAFPVGRQNVTLYSGGPGTVATTIYYPPASSNPDGPGTVVIQTPTAGPEEETPSASASEAVTPIQNVTRIVGGPASVTTTIYIPPTASGEPGVVIIETPTTSPEDEETSSVSITETASDGEATGIPNVTRYVGGPASITTTIYIPPASSGEPGTVLIQTPSAAPDETTTSTPSAESPSDLPNVTRYVGGPASITTTYTIPPASSGEPGTVVIQTPSASPEASATSSPSAEAPTEVPNVTRYVGGPASVTTTYTIPPASSGEPGTVVIQTPSASPAAETTSSEAITSVESPSAIQNVTRFVGGPASVTTTIYIPPASSGEPGTILIQTPSSAPEETSSTATASTTEPPTVAQNTTIFAGGAGSTTRTIYIPPVSEGEPGTVLIETPTASSAASTTPISGAPADIPTTSTPIVAGTNVTIFRAAPATATAGRTLYDPPTAAGEPGTIIVETMVVTPVESSTSGSAAPLSMESPVFTTLSGSPTSSAAAAAASSSSTTSAAAVGPTTSSSTIASTSTTSSAAAVASSSSSASAAAASSSSSAAAAAASSSSAIAAAASSSSNAAAAATSSSSAAAAASSSSAAAAAASSSSSAAAAVASSTSSAAPAPITTSSTSAAAPVVTTSSSAVIPVVVTSSSSTTSTSMMPQLAFGPTFDCDGFGYTVASLLANTLTRVNLNTGARTDIRTGIGPGGPINGIGFNKLDNYIYGFYQQPLVNALLCGILGCKRSGLIRIAKDGRWEVLDLVIGTNAISMGDVDDQGRFWVSEGGGRWWCIDLRPTSTTFGKVLSSGTSNTDLLSGVGDWAYVPGGGNYLYALQASVIESGLLRTNIVRWSTTTQKWERYQSYPGLILTTLNLVWGAVMAAPDGTLFGQESVLGQTWKFSLSSTANPTPIPGGAILNLLGSDGAKCAGALVS
jgi:mucin-19